jgi:D-lactate dehydrogenase
MKIAFFETSKEDEVYLKNALSQEHELIFTHKPLSNDTISVAKDCEIISLFIYSTMQAPLLEQLPKLRLITTRSTGFDHIDILACGQRGIAVSNVPHYGENTVAEHTFALILALSRNVHKSYARGLKQNYSFEDLHGFDLKEKTIGIIGTGHIGLHAIRIAKGFGMHVLATDVHENTFLSEILHYRYTSLEEVLSSSDIISLHLPLSEHTKHLINKDNIRTIKRGALLINTSRGGIISNEALEEALDTGILSGAGLDVIEGEEFLKEEKQLIDKNDGNRSQFETLKNTHAFLSRDNVVFTPHIGFYSVEALERILSTTVKNITTFSAGARAHLVNHPEPCI